MLGNWRLNNDFFLIFFRQLYDKLCVFYVLEQLKETEEHILYMMQGLLTLIVSLIICALPDFVLKSNVTSIYYIFDYLKFYILHLRIPFCVCKTKINQSRNEQTKNKN